MRKAGYAKADADKLCVKDCKGKALCSGGEFADSAGKRQVVKFGGKQHTEKLRNSGEEKIGLGCGGVEGFPSVKPEDRLERTDGTFNGSAFGVEPVPFVRIAH